MKLTKKSETGTKITFTYDKPPGPVEGYLYYADGKRVSRQFNPNDLEVTFEKVPSGKYAVEAVGFDVIDKAEWPEASVPPDSQKPQVSLTSPTAGAQVKGTISVGATANDNVGVTRVEFFCDGISIGSDTVAPFAVPFDTTKVSEGSHTFGARAYDPAGNVGFAAEVTAMVANGTVEPPGPSAPWRGSFDASYQAAPLGSVITVPAGTYGTQVINYRADLAKLSGDQYVKFVMGGPVQINGQLEVHGPRVHVDGGGKLKVSGYTDTEGDSTSRYPDHVLFENLQSGNIGVFSSTDVTFRNIDCGPSTVGANCNRIENKIGYGSGIEVVPKNVLFERVYIHNQNVNAAGRASDCHYGGLFLVTADGLTIRECRFERNVVYHIQIQNFSGPPARNVLIERSSFGAPVEWLEEKGENTPNGQRSVQFDYDPAGQFTLKDNVSANGEHGLYGCYVGNCGGTNQWNEPVSVAAKESGTVNLPVSVVAPPLP